MRCSDGYHGWPEKAPFDAIQISAAPPKIPETLKKQLKIGGKLLSPVGEELQELLLIERRGKEEFIEKSIMDVRFVPMTGRVQNN